MMFFLIYLCYIYNRGVIMKKKKISLIIIVIFVIILLIGVGIFLITKKNNNDYKYIIFHNDNGIPGNNYEIYVNNDYSLKIIDKPACSTVECLEGTYNPEAKTYEINYNDTNKESLKVFLEELFKGRESNKLDTSDLFMSDYQMNLINSITLRNEKIFQLNAENYNYLIEYEDEEYGYYIYFKGSSFIKVNKLTYNEDYEITNIESYEVKFSNESNELIEQLKDDIFSLNNTTRYYVVKDEVSRKELNIIKAIVYNDESLINKSTENRELLFSLTSSSRVNCLTGKLNVYNNNTYEYVTGFTEDGEVIEDGKFSYNVNKILSSLESSEPNERQPFTLTTKDSKTYDIYDNNKYLIEFVSEIEVHLDQCVNYGG